MILVNTDKGLDICKACEENKSLNLVEDSVSNALKVQGHLSHPVKKPLAHDKFIKDYSNLSWEELKRKYLTPSFAYMLKMRIRNIVKLLTLYKLWK